MPIAKTIQDELANLKSEIFSTIIGFKDRVALYRKSKSLLFLDMMSACFFIGILVCPFIVVDSLSLMHSGVIMITLIISFAFVYDHIVKYIESSKQKRLDSWIRCKPKNSCRDE